MDRRKFINASALTGAGLIVSPHLKGNNTKVNTNKMDNSYGTQTSQTIELPATSIPVLPEADVVVIGGGPSGFGAAMRTARSGLNTLLIERFGCPGGAATSGYMCTIGSQRDSFRLHKEWVDQMHKEGLQIFDAFEAYPQLKDNVLVHSSGRINFYPDDGAYVMTEMLEKANVRLLFNTLFVDTVLKHNSSGDDAIDAIVIENASGKQAIRGKVFIDATGNADVVARTGSPYVSAGNSRGEPVPFSLMYKISGVDYAKLFEYQKTDPALWSAIAKARASGDIPGGLYLPYEFEFGGQDGHRGCPQLNMCALGGNGEMLVWNQLPVEWALNAAEDGFDSSRGQIESRKQHIAEVKFLKKYVPGFENAYQSGMAPYMAIREGRHPQGEYVMKWDDVINQRKFPDAVLKRSSGDVMDYSEDVRRRPNEKGELVWKKPPKADKPIFTFDIPYRAFLPKKINNLLLAGQCISCNNDFYWNSRGIPWAMRTGELVGEAASMAVKRGITVKEIKWTSGYLTDPVS